MMTEHDIRLSDGRSLHVWDTETPGNHAVLWGHGSPQTGAPLEPVVEIASRLGIRIFSYGRPSYGGSTANRGRNVASAAGDIAQVADALGIERFGVLGASGGGPHMLAAAALRGDRVAAAVTLAGIAPLTDEFDWFAGMAAPDGLRSAMEGRAARVAFAAMDEFDPSSFIAADYAALAGGWISLDHDVQRSEGFGPDGLIDDDVAFVTAWGFSLESITVPTLIVQGGHDRVVPPSHGEWLAAHIPGVELRRRPHDGHVSVLDATGEALEWIARLL